MIFFASKPSNILDNKDTATLIRKEAAGMKARKFSECKKNGQLSIIYTGNLPEKERLTKAKEFSMKDRLKAGRRRDAAY